MKILTMSDTVAISVYSATAKQRFADMDLALACGDLPAYYLEFVVSMLDVPLYYVVGNHASDHNPQSFYENRQMAQPHWSEIDGMGRATALGMSEQKQHGPTGCTNIDGKIVEHNGLLIGGLQGSMWYNGGPYQYTEQEMARKILLMYPQLLLNQVRYGRAIDILITHAPPAGIHDDVDVAHQGFRCFLAFMERFAPRYLIHGHKHVYLHGEVTETQYQRTKVINTYGFRTLDFEAQQQ